MPWVLLLSVMSLRAAFGVGSWGKLWSVDSTISEKRCWFAAILLCPWHRRVCPMSATLLGTISPTLRPCRTGEPALRQAMVCGSGRRLSLYLECCTQWQLSESCSAASKRGGEVRNGPSLPGLEVLCTQNAATDLMAAKSPF